MLKCVKTGIQGDRSTAHAVKEFDLKGIPVMLGIDLLLLITAGDEPVRWY